MSATANWSYTNTATVKPFVSEDGMTGVIEYGEPFDIACTWAAEAKTFNNSASKGGGEYVSNYITWSEDPRPKARDLILLHSPVATEWQEIRDHIEWDMSFFGETPDYRTIT